MDFLSGSRSDEIHGSSFDRQMIVLGFLSASAIATVTDFDWLRKV